ncbi:MAG: mechanosensitive ion channel [Nitrospinae bacterium]|nr:mechanosensitive ion channel [Nitrospinota bacterium]
MKELTRTLEELPNTLFRWWDQLIAFSPKLLGAIILILLGWVIARIFRAFSLRLAKVSNQILSRFFTKGNLAGFQLSIPLTNLFGKVVFWGTLIFFATAATEILGLTAFSLWLTRLVTYFPQIFAGTLIIVFGVLLSALGRDITLSATEATHIAYSKLLGKVVQGTILFTAVIIGLDQVGIEVTFIVTLLSIVIGSILGSLALALGFGTKDLVSNLISGHHLQKVYQTGQKIRFGNVEGTVLEVNPASMVLSTNEGRMIVPAKYFHTDPSLLMVQEEHEDE